MTPGQLGADLDGKSATPATGKEMLLALILGAVQSTASSTNGTGSTGSGLPYGADEQDITNVAAGPSVIVYKKAGVTLKTRTFTYTNGGGSSTDVLIKTVDS